MMKVKRILKWIIAIAAIAGAVWLLVVGIKLVQTFPVYPGFLREVGTYKRLQKPFAEESAVIFPEEPAGNVTETSYYIYLDGRTLFSETIGYGANYYVEEHNTQIAYSRDCRIEEAGNWTSDTQYRGIFYWLNQFQSEDRVDTPRNHGYLNFYLEDYEYSLGYTVYIAGLAEEEAIALEAQAEEALFQTMHEIIDQYLGE